MATAAGTPQKCVHKGCGKTFTDPDAEGCIYHPGPPEFHEGQKGWKCCKPRVLTFDEFLAIPPCTKGKHSTVEDAPLETKKQAPVPDYPVTKPISTLRSTNGPASSTVAGTSTPTLSNTLHPQPTISRSTTPQPPPVEEDSDPEDVTIPSNATCKRRGCGKTYTPAVHPREEEICIYHPGAPLFHEGSKGWTCCKRRVLEFDEFMKIGGCKERKRHCYVGKKDTKLKAGSGTNGAVTDSSQTQSQEELLEDVRSDFYQTPSSVIVSFYLKKIDKAAATIKFNDDARSVDLDLPTADGKRFRKKVVFWGGLVPDKCEGKIMGTKLELVLAKSDGASWPVLKEGDRETGERIQVGRAGRA